MGQGKSTIVSRITADKNVEIGTGRGNVTVTKEIQKYKMRLDEHDVYVYDTPGINSIKELNNDKMRDKFSFWVQLKDMASESNLMSICYVINCITAERMCQD